MKVDGIYTHLFNVRYLTTYAFYLDVGFIQNMHSALAFLQVQVKV